MASGLPDYYRGVDVAYQALSEVINRPKYGGAVSGAGETVVEASAVTTLVSVSGKGMVYGGFVYLDHTSSQKDSKVWLKIDGQQLNDETFIDLNKYGISQARAYMLSLLAFDDVNFVYGVGLAYGLTFESSLKLEYSELHGSTPNPLYNLVYALV